MKADMEQFWKEVEETDHLVLATSKDDVVTIRPISPLCYNGEIVVCTSPGSRKAAQVSANPNVAVSAGLFYLQGRARSLGPASAPENQAVRAAYGARYPGSFDGGDPQFKGDEIFVSIAVTKLNQWVMDNPEGESLAESLF